MSARKRRRGLWAAGARALFVLAAVAALTACGITPKDDPTFKRVSARLHTTQGNAAVKTYAPVPLADAARTLQQAEQAESRAQLGHLTYLADKKLDIASALAAARANEDRLKKLAREAKAKTPPQRPPNGPAKPMPRLQAPPVATGPIPEVPDVREERTPPSSQPPASPPASGRPQSAAQKPPPDLRVAGLESHQTSQGTVITLPGVLFGIESAKLNDDAEQRLATLADYLNENPNRSVVVQGYTDNSGDPDFNLALSLKRARAVKSYLVDHGVDPQRISTLGRGQNDPLASNKTREGRMKNRRVEIVVLNP